MQLEDQYWTKKSLNEMSETEWEALCDGCGKCCLIKLEDEDTGEVIFTNLACKLLDINTCQCTNYANRAKFVPDCIKMEQDNIEQYAWLPKSCAYRLLSEGKPLYDWHPLISKNPETVIHAGVSAAGRIVSELGVPEEESVDYIVTWPNAEPN